MAVNWPGTAYTRTDLIDASDYPQAAQTNVPANEIVAMQASLGAGEDQCSNGGLLLTLARSAVTVGYSSQFAANDVAGTAITLIANGAKDVTAIIGFMYVIKTSGGAVDAGFAYIANNDSLAIYDDGTNVLTAAVSAVGAFTVQRTAGTATFDVLFASAGWI